VEGGEWRVEESRLRVHGVGFAIKDLEIKDYAVGFRVHSLGLMGSGFRVEGVRVHGIGFKVEGVETHMTQRCSAS